MTFFYETTSWSSQQQPDENRLKLWKHIADKKNWRIVQLPNGYYQQNIKTFEMKTNGKMLRGEKQWRPLKHLLIKLLNTTIRKLNLSTDRK